MAMSGIQSRNGQALGALLQTNPESPGSLINVSALSRHLLIQMSNWRILELKIEK